jgi:hypothetical protein
MLSNRTNDLLNGIHEAVGSIPSSSTRNLNGLAVLGWPIFLLEGCQGAAGVQLGALVSDHLNHQLQTFSSLASNGDKPSA